MGIRPLTPGTPLRCGYQKNRPPRRSWPDRGLRPLESRPRSPKAPVSTNEIHRPPLRARLAPTLWKNPGEGRRLKEVDSWTERPAILRDSWLRGFSHSPRPGRELVPANKSGSQARVGRSLAPVIRWQDHGCSFFLVSNSLNTKFFFKYSGGSILSPTDI